MTSLTAVDSSTIIAILKAEPEAFRFLDVVNAGNLVLGATTLLEIRIWCIRRRDQTTLKWLEEFVRAVQLAPFDSVLERKAAMAYQRFGKGLHPASLNFGDAMAYAIAIHHDAPLLFKGADFGLTDVRIHPASVMLA